MEHFINGYNFFWETLFNLPWSRVVEVLGWLTGLLALLTSLIIGIGLLTLVYDVCLKRRKLW